MITPAIKNRIVEGLKVGVTNFGGSATRYAKSLGINPASYSRIISGDIDQVLSDPAWASVARKIGINIKSGRDWKTAKTPVYEYVYNTLSKCQSDSISSIICDLADIGKTYTATAYAMANKNVVYIDCSQVKSKQKLVRKIAQEFGVDHTGRYNDVYADLVYYIQALENPMIILDEAGDLLYDAFLELKALWNATERACGWCMIGADGLKEKIRRAITNKKVGYVELFSRFGKRFQRATPEGAKEAEEFSKLQAALILKANVASGTDIKKMIISTDGSLRRIYNEISKL
jgi:DNA transposition AAA+ family ATPase